jgi:hypothetical protein
MHVMDTVLSGRRMPTRFITRRASVRPDAV